MIIEVISKLPLPNSIEATIKVKKTSIDGKDSPYDETLKLLYTV